MRFTRFLLILVLSFALPIHGFAALAAVPCCPLQQDQDAASMQTGQGCCHQGDPAGHSDTPCKCGQMCKTGKLLQAAVAPSAFFPPGLWQPMPQSTTLAISRDASGVWRPPRLS